MNVSSIAVTVPANEVHAPLVAALIGGHRGDVARAACLLNGRRTSIHGSMQRYHAWVALIGDEVAGVCHGIETATDMVLYELFVAPQHRRKGVASTLLFAPTIEAEYEQLAMVICCRQSDHTGLRFLREWGYRRCVDEHGHDVLRVQLGDVFYVLSADARIRIAG